MHSKNRSTIIMRTGEDKEDMVHGEKDGQRRLDYLGSIFHWQIFSAFKKLLTVHVRGIEKNRMV